MLDPILLKPLRLAAGLTQAQAAREAGMPQPELSKAERGARPLPPAAALRLVPLYAIGKPAESEGAPRFCLVRVRSDIPAPQISTDGRLRVYVRPEVASAALALARVGGLQNVAVAPIWAGGAAMALFAHHSGRPEEGADAMVTVDAGRVPEDWARLAAEHALNLLDLARRDDSEAAAELVAEIVARADATTQVQA